MRAMTVTEFGGLNVLKIQDIERPEPGENDVLIAVHACGLNPVDFKIRKNGIGAERRFPFVLGYDVSGVVEAMGANVEGFQVGDEVWASPNLFRNGSNAEYVAVDYRVVGRKPDKLSHVEAAALPLVTITAWEALYDRMNIQGHETVLVSGGGGGVGHVAVQLACARRCRVITTASEESSIQLARDCGADEVINYRETDVVEAVTKLTDGQLCPAVLDTVGGDSFNACVSCVAVDGRIALINGIPKESQVNSLFIKGATIHFEFMGVAQLHSIRLEEQRRVLDAAANLVSGGSLKPHVSTVLPLEDLAKAHEMQESGHTTGKIVLTVR